MSATKREVRWSWRVGALSLGMILVLSGSVAVASIPQGNTFNACRNATTGALRVIDPSKGQKCAAGEVFLRWNRWTWRSTWLPQPQYYVADVVSYGGSSYIARVRPPIGTAPTNTQYWSLVASKGAIGVPGVPGVPGLAGATGPQGLAGLAGPTGPQGLPGVAGATGLVGPTGSQGLPGVAGATGLVGPTGSQGLPGVAGPTGAIGPTGPAGVVDAIFAKINGNGTLAYGNHVTSSSVSGLVTPTYTLNFDQNVSQCVVNAVSGQAVAIPVITVHGPTSISLTFALLTGVLTQTPFEVTVTC